MNHHRKTYIMLMFVVFLFMYVFLCTLSAHASCFNVQPLHDFYAEQGRKVSYGGHFSSLESALSHVQSIAATHGGSPSYSNVNTGNGAFQVAYVSYYTPDGNLFYYTTWNTDNPIACETDTDGDGIADKYDLNPGSDTPYNAAIVSVCYDANNNIVAGIIQDDQGNRFMFGTMPDDLDGHTIESVEGDGINYRTGEAIANALQNLGVDVNLSPLEGSNLDIQDDGTIIPGTSDPLIDWKNKEENQITAPEPDTQDAPSHQPQADDTDSKHFENIVKNTDATNKNLENISKYLGISNDLLAKINAKTDSNSATGGGAVVIPGEGTTIDPDAVGQAVEDHLIDPGQTIDTTITDNIPAIDENTTLTAIQTKYTDRYNQFLTTIKSSDLFSLPFSIFNGPSGSGASVKTVSIGKWGASTDQSVSIDFAEYGTIWQTLRSVILLITSYACVKILLLKKA